MKSGEATVRIHPTAVIHPSAELGPGVRVGAYARVGPGARVGRSGRLGPRAQVGADVQLDEGVLVDAGAIVGSLEERGRRVEVGAFGRIRECAVVEGGLDVATRIGPDVFVMSRTWIGAGAFLEAGSVVTHGSVVGPGVRIGEHAVVGGMTLVEPGVAVGRRAMVGSLSWVRYDVPPFLMAHGSPAALHGLNLVGLRRGGVKADVRMALQRLFRVLFRSGAPPGEALESVDDALLESREAREVWEFVCTHPGARAIAQVAPSGGAGEDDGTDAPL